VLRHRLLLLSTADTDLLAARHADPRWTVANPARLQTDELADLAAEADVVVLRLLGGEQAWPDGLGVLQERQVPLVALGGEAVPDAQMMARSTVPAGVAAQTLEYLREGGPANLTALAGFLCDALFLTGEPFDPPQPMPEYGVHERPSARSEGPTVGVVFYRAHELSGNTAFVDTVCEAVERQGANALPVFCPSLRALDDGLVDLLARCDAIVVTVLAAGGTSAASATAGGDDDAWSIGELANLDVPVVQAMCLTSTREAWQGSDAALTPMDAAMQVAIPEFDGRVVTVPVSFKQTGADGVPVYVGDPERADRAAGTAVRLARLRHRASADKKVALVLSSYPTKHARVGNAVGLDTPASAVRLLIAMRDAGYDLGDLDVDTLDGDALVHRLIEAGGHDVEWLTEDQLRQAWARIPAADYRAWFDRLPEALRADIEQAWGPPPGELYVDDGHIVLAALRFGNVVLAIQPPRGFGENPVAIYHDPALAPSHHYLAAYRYLDEVFGADAVVHLGKHGTLEWLPGKGLGLSAECAPDQVLADVPMFYPFIVNDPGEGTQAKRRAHAVVVDHLVPPMARADTYGDMAKLEQLLDEYATVADLDPDKLPTVRAQIWTLIKSAELHHDLHVDEQPDDEEFDDFLLHVDGYLCEVKDVQIRDGLHILGAAPEGEARVNLVLAVLRASQVWGGVTDATPGLRAAIARWAGLDEQALLADPGAPARAEELPEALVQSRREGDATGGQEPPAEIAQTPQQGDTPPAETAQTPHRGVVRNAADVVDLLEGAARRLVEGCEGAGWDADALEDVCADVLGEPVGEVVDVLRFAAAELLPRLARTTDEVGTLLHALEGGFVPAGPSGSPTRGLVNVLPTGRNFYSVDPKAIPSRNAFDVGVALAESLLRRHRDDTGDWPRSVGLTVWGTSAMRTQGDDLAEVLWLLGCRPVWDDASRRVTGFDVVPVSELGRPRIDVTVRISGFFRDAFPHVVSLLDDAVTTVAALEEDPADNYVRAHVLEDLRDHGDQRRATSRIFGSKPGAYGAGLLPLIDARNWRSDEDLAEVYATWGGYAYGRGLDGREARADMEASYRRMQVAAKNVDNREHDLVDSDDYFQYHGGMVAMVRHLTGSDPQAYIGDSAVPSAVRTRTLGEETRRVFRARVVNPRWMAAMRRHGYKGAFEMAASVDYLFGYDATAGVVDDWMYESLAQSYVFDEDNRKFFDQSNPWALRGITERLLEAHDRGLWAQPSEETLERLRHTYLELEGDLEGD
jgi:cobaltochelatase CobN